MLTELEKINLLPEEQRNTLLVMMALRPDDLVEQPEVNKWYTYYPENCICSNKVPYKGTMKIGTENKLLILFCGGGVAADAYSAARPDKINQRDVKETFYLPDTDVIGYFFGRSGLANQKIEENPYKNWSVVVIPYASGDFHCGTNDFYYNDEEVGEGVCHHLGYLNFCAMIEKIQEFVPNPEEVIISGFSAGGFGAALLTNDIISKFPKCEDFYCLIDSSSLEYDGWTKTAVNQWKAPESISEVMMSNNLMVDAILDANSKQGKKLKLAFTCTYRDALLVEAQSYLDFRVKKSDKVTGDRLQQVLRNTYEVLHKAIPNMSFYFYDMASNELEGTGLTDHTIIGVETVFNMSYEGIRMIDWIANTQKGTNQNVGVELLYKEN
ncbi:pectin acetylesterase-family hydrolase [Agrilactobacillus yilanensis]|uniref:Pectin acetylesterase-family hydrolase n=1 Tax=Agrilactobacillus yilanensis TaxID=2485997 RepID=A0ABW4J5Y1_9LACO|nr:pectin acetylesterase-family hydrolase [Agrilactobacillus yilanensis]